MFLSSEFQQFTKDNKFVNNAICSQETYSTLVNDIQTFKPINPFEELAQHLLLTVLLPSKNNKFIYTVNNHFFGFEYQRNYSGLMAKKTDKPKRGLFDFKIRIGDSLDYTHYQAMKGLLANSTLQNCKSIWQDATPNSLTPKQNEMHMLEVLKLMLFEQEINWGDEDFQAYSAFSPNCGAKPRDMLMGFIDMAFALDDVDKIPNWITNKYNPKIKMTPNFGGRYKDYDKTLKAKHFNPYRTKSTPLMQGTIKNLFNKTAKLFNNNPN
ncbi:hypothetical protein ACQVPP_17730 [Bacillus luti]|uniref:hypothetical protein n=1 Tax=Bacillus cereus group TaxID=86661 RepID=UPI00387A75DB